MPESNEQTLVERLREYAAWAPGSLFELAADTLAYQAVQITELQAEVERRGSETNAGYFATQLEAMTRERDAYIRACDSYLEEITDLKRALDTARKDALEEAAKEIETRLVYTNGQNVVLDIAREDAVYRTCLAAIRALQTKDQPHGQ